MTKKRLSDVLRQEAQKSLDIDNKPEASQDEVNQGEEKASEPTPKSTANSPKAANQRHTKQPRTPPKNPPASVKASTVKASTVKASTVKASTTKTPTTKAAGALKSPEDESITVTAAPESSAPESNPRLEAHELADLKGAIADLEAALKTAYQTETTLRQTISNLESELQQQHDRVQALTPELEQADRNKAELEQTKQLILTLSENNITLTQELEGLKRKSKPSNTLSLQPSSSPRSSSSRNLGYRSFANLELRKILEHPVQKEQPSTTFSDAEIGWVD